MSRDGRSERLDGLRDAIARIEGDAPARFNHVRPARSRVTLGHDLALDAALRGGLGRGALHEVVAAAPGDAGAASGFALALAVRFAIEEHAPIIWILEDEARAESGAPYAPGLSEHGMSPDRLIVVGTANGSDSLWAMEEALKCRAVGAVVADLWRTRSYDLTASRRLVLAARANGTTGLLVPAGAAGSAPLIASAAHTRFEVRAASGTPVQAAGGHPLPGRAAWSVRLARLRTGPRAGHGGEVEGDGIGVDLDRDRLWPLAWDHEKAWFCDALPFPLASHVADRPRPQAIAARIGARTGARTSASTGAVA